MMSKALFLHLKNRQSLFWISEKIANFIVRNITGLYAP